MNLKSMLRLAMVVVPAIVVIGCASASGKDAPAPAPVQELFSSLHCQATGKQFQAHWVREPGQAEAIAGWPRTPGSTHGGSLLTWEPQQESRLWIHMGQKPTGGYSLHLARSEAGIENGVATVQVEFRHPPADAFVAQVLTSPCLVLKIGGADFHTIHIQDQDGEIRARLH